ncbi:MAG: SWIM zinc finger family protein [Kiritimatiellia bacterium]|jgi:uncharacterized Zn finger protein
MSRYGCYYYDSYSRFPDYVTVGERKAKAEATAARLAKKGGAALSPIVLEGRTIARTFWGKAWCDNIESYQDFSNRLPRGRTYVRSGAVIDLQIAKGEATALVCGSSRSPYKIKITIAPLAPSRWEALKKRCLGKIDSLVALIQGKLSAETLAVLCDRDNGIFPSPDEIKMDCSCPDWAGLCKHLAAALYGIGARLDTDPSLFFVLRGVDQNELVTADAVDALTEGVASEIDESQLSDVFGVDFDTGATLAVAESAPSPAPVPTHEPAPSAEQPTTSAKPAKPAQRAAPKKAASKTAKKVPAKAKAATKKAAASSKAKAEPASEPVSKPRKAPATPKAKTASTPKPAKRAAPKKSKTE